MFIKSVLYMCIHKLIPQFKTKLTGQFQVHVTIDILFFPTVYTNKHFQHDILVFINFTKSFILGRANKFVKHFKDNQGKTSNMINTYME